MKQKIVVAMSGGVDSSVAAALLVEEGHEVVGMTMKTWGGNQDVPGGKRTCCGLDDVEDARRVASSLDIPYYVLNLQEPFGREVIQDFVAEYLGGRTPNPCVRCNSFLKFGSLLGRARTLGFDKVATGHYARVFRDAETGRHVLARGRDPSKDQAYTLYGLNQEQLARAVLPLGNRTKEETRAEASRLGLAISDKPDSQDICFVPGDYRDFLKGEAGAWIRPGRYVDDEGNELGRHDGAPYHTIGQRRGMGVASSRGRLYVTRVETGSGDVTLGGREDLLCDGLDLQAVNWVSIRRPLGEVSCEVQLRAHGRPLSARVIAVGETEAQIRFSTPQLRTAAGQSAVFYDGGGRVLGGGLVRRAVKEWGH